jgi:ADP-heptose:LPS heptosyltransferase
MTQSIRNVLIIQPYGIGDALFMTPVLRALRTLPTVEKVDLLLGSRTEAVFRHNPHVDRIFSIDKGKWHASRKEMTDDLKSLWKQLSGKYDLLIDYSLQREYGFNAEFFLGIPQRIGLNFKNRSFFLTKSVSLKDGYEGAPAADFYCEVAKLIGLEIEDRFLEFYVSDEDREEANSVIPTSPYVCIAPGGGESWGKDAFFKRWPAEYFAEMLSLLKSRLDFEGVFILGSKTERELGEEIIRRGAVSAPFEGRGNPAPTFNVINLCGEISLGATAAILEKSILFLANDGGLVHLAHALQTPLVAFYGPVDPAVYGPSPKSAKAVSIFREGLPCRPCYFRFRYNSACVDRECLTELPPDEAIRKLDKINFWNELCAKA